MTNYISNGVKIFALLILAVFLFRPIPDKKTVEITVGMSATQIARVLTKEKIIKKPGAFLYFLRLSGSTKDLKSGRYYISPGQNYLTLIKSLVKGSDIFVRVTIPEGFTAEQIARRLYENKIINDKGDFIKKIKERELRGFLFPETYNFSPGDRIDDIIAAMKKQFFKVFTESYRKRAKESGYTIKEIITLASLIEKEAKVPDERPVISAIFHKRLKKRIYLESCASVLFAIGKHKDRLRYKDLEIDSPYNTYKNFGLPPTPICNPGEESLRAALYPADTDYLYFFSKGDGFHIFSTAYEEHLRLQKDFRKFKKKFKNSP